MLIETLSSANKLCSYVCYHCDDSKHNISKEWPIFQRDCSTSPFSEWGDSSSVVVDGRGRVEGLLTTSRISRPLAPCWSACSTFGAPRACRQ